jgi:YD repeat-containing protein
MSTRNFPRSLSVAFILAISLLGTNAADEVFIYSYDAALRLTAITRVTPPNTGSGNRIEYVYDASGNVLGRTGRAFTDSDVDGLDDLWEQANFGSLTRDGRGDFDNDGASDIAEFLAETNPKDASSVLRITRLNSQAQLEWRSQSGVRYRVQYTDSLTAPSWRQIGDDVVASGSLSQFSDSLGIASRERFYRVVAVR